MSGHIVYRSQMDSDAAQFGPDCGPACVGMIVQTLTGVRVSTDALARQTSLPVQAAQVADGKMARSAMGLNVPELVSLLKAYRVNARAIYLPLSGIDAALARGGYVIPLVEYQYIPARQHKIACLHYIVIYAREGDYYITADPYWSGALRSGGATMRVHRNDMARATRRCGGLSVDVSGLLEKSVPATHAVNTDALNVRAAPTLSAAITARLPQGLTVTANTLTAQRRADGYLWQALAVPEGWVAAQFLRPILRERGLSDVA